jgi:hypothetical protein
MARWRPLPGRLVKEAGSQSPGRFMSPPGDSLFDEPEHWRERAKETRNFAEQLTDPIVRAMMLRIAEDYERLAENAQQRVTSGDGKL